MDDETFTDPKDVVFYEVKMSKEDDLEVQVTVSCPDRNSQKRPNLLVTVPFSNRYLRFVRRIEQAGTGSGGRVHPRTRAGGGARRIQVIAKR